MRQVLIYGVGKAGLAFNDMADIDAVIALIAQKRRMPGFGNAGTVNSMVNFAKAAKSKRIGEAQKAYDAAIKQGRGPEPMPNPDLLLRSDFIQNEVDVASSCDAFANLYNMDHSTGQGTHRSGTAGVPGGRYRGAQRQDSSCTNHRRRCLLSRRQAGGQASMNSRGGGNKKSRDFLCIYAYIHTRYAYIHT